MLVVDAFVFYNELDMLNYRLNVLDDHVDYFVIVESTHTFSGISKPLFFKENCERFAKFEKKIIHIVITDFPQQSFVCDGRQWENERFQREEGIRRGLANVPGLQDSDFVIYSDLDEIINPNLIRAVRDGKIGGAGVYSLEMDMYYYNLTTYAGKWSAPTLLTAWYAKQFSYRYSNKNILPNAGWHLSYFGDTEFIRNKIVHFGHQEYNKEEYINTENLTRAVNTSSDLFKRNNITFRRIEMKDNNNLPPRLDLLANFCK
jgi:beta-1,4-mannosyl-glycoprotein beta-1,4-N-acetylglucosaminyltransferase